MNICKTCEHWDTAVWASAKKLGLGICHSPSMATEATLTGKDGPHESYVFMGGGATGHHCTGPNFGCIHHNGLDTDGKNYSIDVDAFLTENGVTSEVGTPARIDQYGNEYTEYTLAGVFGDDINDRLMMAAKTEAAAERQCKAVILSALAGKKHIVWRIKPEKDYQPNLGWRAYWRFSAYPTTPPPTPSAHE